jgi:hypothetical protein
MGPYYHFTPHPGCRRPSDSPRAMNPGHLPNPLNTCPLLLQPPTFACPYTQAGLLNIFPHSFSTENTLPLADKIADSSSRVASMQVDNRAVSPFDRTIVWILSLLNPCTKHAYARRLLNATALITSVYLHILYTASLNSDCMVSILLLHDAMLSLAPCPFQNIQNA